MIISSFLKLISKKRKIQLSFAILIMLLSAFFESLTLTLLGPFLAIISTSSEKIILNNQLQNMKQSLQLNNDKFVIYLAIIFVSFIIIGSIIRTFNVYIVNRLSASIGTELSVKSYEKYIKKNYEYHVNNNSSQLITIISKFIDQTVMVVNAFLMLIVSSLISLSVFFILLLKEFNNTIIFALFFIVSYFFIIKKVRPRLNLNGKYYNLLANKQVKHIQESLGSIREIKLSSNYKFYSKKHKLIDFDMRKRLSQNNFITQAPKFILESIGLSLVISVAVYLSINNSSSNVLLPSLATISLGGLRLLTSMNQAFAYWTTIRANRNGLKEVINRLNDKFGDEQNQNLIFNSNKFKFLEKSDKKFISFVDVSYSFFNRKKDLFKKINLLINSGDKIGIKGVSGSGKTTLVDLLVGLLKPQSGQIYVDGKDITLSENEIYLREWQNQISYAPQMPYLVDDSILVNIAIGLNEEEIDFERVKKVAKIAQIHNFISDLSKGYRTVIGESGLSLSGGQRQRLAIARALYRKSKILIMDESTSALDENTEKKLIDSIENFSKELTLIMIAHRTSTLQNCNKIICVRNGEIIISDKIK